MALKITITDAGRAEIINAANTGTAPVTLTQIGFTAATFTPTAALTALPSEIKRVTSIAGEIVAPDTISVTAKDEGTDAYTMRGFGIFTASGTLFAVYGQAEPIIEKASGATMLLTIDVILADIDAANLEFGDISFSNPPASNSTPGVVTLNNAVNSTAQNQAATPAAVKTANDNANTRLAKSQNLADLVSAAAARVNLGLGASATLGNTALRTSSSTTVLLQAAAMNDHRTSGDHDARYPQRGNNLSDLPSPSQARSNIGLGASSTMGTTASRTSTATNIVLQAAAMNNHRHSDDHDGRYIRRTGDTGVAPVTFDTDVGPGLRFGGGPLNYNTVDFVTRLERFTQYFDTDHVNTVEWRTHSDGSGHSNALTLNLENGDLTAGGTYYGDGSGLTGTAPLRATGTTKEDVGLGNLPNSTTASRTSSSTTSLLQAAAMNSHRQSGDHDARYPQLSGTNEITGSNRFTVGNVLGRNFEFFRAGANGGTFGVNLGNGEFNIESIDAPSTYSSFALSADGRLGIGRRPLSNYRMAVAGRSLIDGGDDTHNALSLATTKDSDITQEGSNEYTLSLNNNSLVNDVPSVGMAFSVSGSTPSTPGAAITFTRTGGWSYGRLDFYTKNGTASGSSISPKLTIREDGNVEIANSVNVSGTISSNVVETGGRVSLTRTANSTANSTGTGLYVNGASSTDLRVATDSTWVATFTPDGLDLRGNTVDAGDGNFAGQLKAANALFDVSGGNVMFGTGEYVDANYGSRGTRLTQYLDLGGAYSSGWEWRTHSGGSGFSNAASLQANGDFYTAGDFNAGGDINADGNINAGSGLSVGTSSGASAIGYGVYQFNGELRFAIDGGRSVDIREDGGLTARGAVRAPVAEINGPAEVRQRLSITGGTTTAISTSDGLYRHSNGYLGVAVGGNYAAGFYENGELRVQGELRAAAVDVSGELKASSAMFNAGSGAYRFGTANWVDANVGSRSSQLTNYVNTNGAYAAGWQWRVHADGALGTTVASLSTNGNLSVAGGLNAEGAITGQQRLSITSGTSTATSTGNGIYLNSNGYLGVAVGGNWAAGFYANGDLNLQGKYLGDGQQLDNVAVHIASVSVSGNIGTGNIISIPSELQGKFRAFRLTIMGGITGEIGTGIIIRPNNDFSGNPYRYNATAVDENFNVQHSANSSSGTFPRVGFMGFEDSLLIVDYVQRTPGSTGGIAWVSKGFQNSPGLSATHVVGNGVWQPESAETVTSFRVRTPSTGDNWAGTTRINLWGFK